MPAAAQIGLLGLLTLYAATLLPGGVWTGLGRLLPALLVLGAASAGLWWWARRRGLAQLQQAIGTVTAIGEG
ncbi:methyl-accepting chemotaxis protein, partial [Xanthomonas citri pv. citri]|nr:methyl-accepting chemotaxis protein [Xanthomonas citri pv. citri]